MADWFRMPNGAAMDNRWLAIGKKTGVAPGVVAAVVWALMDHASQADDRGDVSRFDIETYAAFSGFEETDVQAIIVALAEKGFLEDGRVTNVSPFSAVVDRMRLPWSQWRDIRQAVFDRDGFACTYCGDAASTLECDHIIPLSQGGSNDLENLTTACMRCNRSKRDKTPDEWRLA